MGYGILFCMKKHSRQIENILLSVLVVGGMLAIYLFAGRQERAYTVSSETETGISEETASLQEQSEDGRLRDAVLAAFSDAGYTVTASGKNDGYTLSAADGSVHAELLLSTQGVRVNGLTLRAKLPSVPERKNEKKPTLAEQAAEKRHEKDIAALKERVKPLLAAALNAIDPYETVPSTERLYWEALMTEAVSGDHTASDAGQPIQFRVYEAEDGEEKLLCILLQMK